MDKDQKHIPFAVIVAATNGDEAAIQEILDFYDGYISKLSLRKLYDKYGNVYMVVDSELKGRIQAAVMDMIALFSYQRTLDCICQSMKIHYLDNGL